MLKQFVVLFDHSILSKPQSTQLAHEEPFMRLRGEIGESSLAFAIECGVVLFDDCFDMVNLGGDKAEELPFIVLAQLGIGMLNLFRNNLSVFSLFLYAVLVQIRFFMCITQVNQRDEHGGPYVTEVVDFG